MYKKSLQIVIPREVIRSCGRTDVIKWPEEKGQTKIYKTLHI
jgi:hypothetical protein